MRARGDGHFAARLPELRAAARAHAGGGIPRGRPVALEWAGRGSGGGALPLAACSTATLVAMALPWLLHRLGRDPAYGSRPLATVVQDLLSVLMYLVIALNLVRCARPPGGARGP